MDQLQDQGWTARLPIAELDQTGPIRRPRAPKAKPQQVEAAKPAAQAPAAPDWREEFMIYVMGMREWSSIHFRRCNRRRHPAPCPYHRCLRRDDHHAGDNTCH